MIRRIGALLLLLLLLTGCGKGPGLPRAQLQLPPAPQAAAPDPAPTERWSRRIAVPVPGTQPRIDPLQPELQALVDQFCRDSDETWDIALESLDGAWRAGTEPAGPRISASLIKLFVMGAVHTQLEQGLLDQAQCDPLLRAMITVSDNYSTNRLVELLGAGDPAAGMEQVNSFARAMDCPDTTMNRLMLAGNGLENYTTAADCSRFLLALTREECVTPDRSRQMLELLQAQTVNNRLPVGLPEGVPVAHKTGDLIGLCCGDAGIVYGAQAAYVISVICDHPRDDYRAALEIGSLSQQVYGLLHQD